MSSDGAFDDEFDQAYEILNQESQEAVEAYRNNNPSRQSMDHLEQLLSVLKSLRMDVEQGLKGRQDGLDEAVENLRSEIKLDDEKDSLAHDLEENWEEFEYKLDEQFNAAQQQKKSRTEKLSESFSETLGGLRSSDEDQSNSESDSDELADRGPAVKPDELSSILEAIEERFLNPLLRDEEEVTEQQKALENLTDVLKQSVELHQDANKYKLILLHAKRDTHLQEDLAEHSDIEWFNNEVMEAGKQEQRLEDEVQKIMEAEKQFISSLEEAHELLGKALELDRDVVQTISEASAPKKKRDKVIGAFAGGDEHHIIDKLSLINSVYDQDYSPLIDHLSNEFRPKVEELEQMEDMSLREEMQLREEVEQYIEQHKRLMQQDKEEMERERDKLTLEGPVEDVRNGAPYGTAEYISIIEDLRTLLNNDVLADIRAAEEDYRTIYRIDDQEVEEVHDLAGRAKELNGDLSTLERQFVNETAFENAFQAVDSADKLKREMERLMNGEDPFEVGLRPVADNIEKIQADIQRIYSDEEKESRSFEDARRDLEREMGEVQRIVEDFRQLEEIVERFKDPDHKRNTVNGQSHPYRAYHDAFLSATKKFFNGVDGESQKQMQQLLKDIVGMVQEIEQEISNQRELMQKVIEEEHVDEEALKEALQMLDQTKNNLEEAFKGSNIDTPLPNPVSTELDDIDKAIEKIEQEIGDLEERKEGEEEEARDEFNFVDEELEELDEAESTAEEMVEDTEKFSFGSEEE